MESQKNAGCLTSLLVSIVSVVCLILGLIMLEDYDIGFLFIIIGIIGGIIALVVLFSDSSNEQQNSSEQQLKQAKSLIQESNNNLKRYLNFIAENEVLYGLPIKSIGAKSMKFLCLIEEKGKEDNLVSPIPSYHIQYDYLEQKWAMKESYLKVKRFPPFESIILVYGDAKKIVLQGRIFNYKDILSYQVTDNSTQIISGGQAISSTKTDTGSMLGRGIVGGLVGGGVGAIIGSTSASKTTTTKYTDQNIKTTHHYILYIYVNDLANPIVKYDFNYNEEMVQECVATLNVIVNSNK